jgi:hypothetical protein
VLNDWSTFVRISKAGFGVLLSASTPIVCGVLCCQASLLLCNSYPVTQFVLWWFKSLIGRWFIINELPLFRSGAFWFFSSHFAYYVACDLEWRPGPPNHGGVRP